MFTSIGTDPEYFVRDKTTKEIVSFSGRFGHTKENPRLVKYTHGPQLNKDFYLMEDNVAIEFATPAVTSLNELITVIFKGRDLISEILDPMGLEIAEGNAYTFSDEELAKGNAWEFGCEPDFCVYKLKMMVPPPLPFLKSKGLQNLRTTGGHIHLGVSNQIDKIKFGRILDYFLGNYSLKHEPPLPRRILYGRAGAIRLKNYGLEYRSIGNFWTLDKDKIKEVFELCREATYLAYDLKNPKTIEILACAAETKAKVNGIQTKKDEEKKTA